MVDDKGIEGYNMGIINSLSQLYIVHSLSIAAIVTRTPLKRSLLKILPFYRPNIFPAYAIGGTGG